MTSESTLPPSDVAILDRLIRPERDDLSAAAAARDLLKIDFEPGDIERMHELAAKAREGVLTPAERAEIHEYDRVGHVLALLHSKARRSLKRQKKTGA
jgi:uncharacterized protein YnzC (UPF0291/DUF896 family)